MKFVKVFQKLLIHVNTVSMGTLDTITTTESKLLTKTENIR